MVHVMFFRVFGCGVSLIDLTSCLEVIIMDLDDPLEGGPCYWLYCKDTVRGWREGSRCPVKSNHQEGPFRAPFRSRQGDLVKPNGIFVTFQESKGDPQIECDRIDELGDFLHTKIPKIPVLKVFSGGWNLKYWNKRSTMLKTLLFVSIHVNQWGSARGLTQEFYEMCKTKLNPGGILVTQAEGEGLRHGWWSDDVGERDFIKFLTWLSSHFRIDGQFNVCTLKS